MSIKTFGPTLPYPPYAMSPICTHTLFFWCGIYYYNFHKKYEFVYYISVILNEEKFKRREVIKEE